MNAIERIEQVCRDYGLEKVNTIESQIQRAVMVAEGVQQVLAALTPEVMRKIMPLQGKSLGFRTDKDRAGGYSEEEVRLVCAEALLRGAAMAGNEVNIIAGNFYPTLQFFRRKVREFPGLTDLREDMSVPALQEGRTVVQYKAQWNLNGKPDSLEKVVSIRVNSGMGDDGILGKANRKGLAAIYARLTGSLIPDGAVDEERPLRPAVAEVVADEPAPSLLPPPAERDRAAEDAAMQARWKLLSPERKKAAKKHFGIDSPQKFAEWLKDDQNRAALSEYIEHVLATPED